MTELPSVSVIVVNYQRPLMLARVLKAFEFQVYDTFELIVVSDLQPENRPESKLPIKWVQFDQANISAARNNGLRIAAGEIVAFIDDDAVPENRWLSHLVQPYEDKNVGFVGGFVRGRNGISFQWKAQTIDTQGVDRSAHVTPEAWTIYPPGNEIFLNTVGTNCSFRRTALFELGGFDEAYHYFLDEADLCIRFARAGWSGAIVPLAEVHHGLAVGPYRAKSRVPKDLSEIFASMTYFLKSYCDPSDVELARHKFRKIHQNRIRHYFHYGMIDRKQAEYLLQSMKTGSKAAEHRERNTPLRDLPTYEFMEVRAPLAMPHTILVSKFFNRKSMRQEAKNLAKNGQLVTLFTPRFTHNNLVVSFNIDGYWEHDFGLLGHADREKPRLCTATRNWVDAETSRIGLQRGIEI